MYLENINGPEDIKKLNIDQLQTLASETREALIYKLSHTGGHVGSNLGVVELTVALHYVFSSPIDKIIWDVSHQCYPHKILTGRKQAYTEDEHFKDVNGFTDPGESIHDVFRIGHSSTSISLALGLAKGRDVFGNDENIIAIIGDGALSGGEAYEGFNYAGEYGKNLILIINDNAQSISENHGGLFSELAKLRETGGTHPNNYFKSLGLDYKYLDDGHNVVKIVELLQSVKGTLRPVVLHIHTTKGKGLPYAELEAEQWHSASPFHSEDGTPVNGYPNYDMTLHDSLVELLNADKHSVVITAATPRAVGFVGEDRAMWMQTGRFIDVGIAEENAMAISSGIAKYGGTAVFCAYAPFLQRTYDQLSHDVCLNNSPTTILVLMPGAYGMKSNTHLGLCDIQMFSHVPNLVYLSPAYREEYLQMFRYATSQRNHPTAIRVPNSFYDCGIADTTDYSIINRGKIMREGSSAAIIAVGTLIPKALAIADEYERQTGKVLTVINPIFLTGTDNELLDSLADNHSLVITIEDGELDSGYGQKIASYYGDTDMKVINLGITKAFHSDFNADMLMAECGISADNIIKLINEHNL